MTIFLDGQSLTLTQIKDVARRSARVSLRRSQLLRIRKSRQAVERKLREEIPLYGITTGVGKLATTRISANQAAELQRNIVLSHSTGVGPFLPQDVTRAVVLLRANTLAKGYSGVRAEVIQFLIDLLNHRIHPRVPEVGSVGASGDLAPLAHVALVLIGEGEVEYRGMVRRTQSALKKIALKPLSLAAKEGLSLVNGTQATLGIMTLALLDAERLCDLAELAGAMSVDALRGSPAAFDRRIHAVRPHPGQVRVAKRLSKLLKGSQIRESHRGCKKVQDAYSLRCIPQVHGACRDLVRYVRSVVEAEINSATDNPLVFWEDDEILSGGNFHGEPLALAADALSIALSELASISERRVARLLDASLSGLPPFLTRKSGLHSGFMTAHLTSVAALGENKVLSHPASVDSLPTSGEQEDHVSMSYTAALKAWKIRENLETALAVEFLCAAQALDLLRPLRSSRPLEKAHHAIRNLVPFLDADRPLYRDILAMKNLLREDTLLECL
ncbi:histidine ammonia-lyase [candidate division TA06 bacterium DG_26]|uniref:Histidine ammonia-lyase n=1 Tax=candidate division TA06 bacterium DG_26 TaxID=1703771 RepID=A0A0S7WIW5_UNCT6|nr:MAG: histidine ammonia-lyase [candidate division TA06 bacterium DG_26]